MKKLKNTLNFSISFILVIALFSCSTHKNNSDSSPILPQEGLWRMEMHLAKDAILPFTFDLIKNQDSWQASIYNADEKIEVDNISLRNDTLQIKLPIFESEFVLSIKDSSLLEGYWHNYYKGSDYKIKCKAEYNKAYRFSPTTNESKSLLFEKYEVTFSPNSDDEYKSIGLFKTEGNAVNGTFATETGDYRHLEGATTNDSLFLSTFDGSHAFLFKAAINDSTLEGTFWSGNHFQETWVAKLNPDFNLRNADSLTFLKEGYNQLRFSFPNAAGEMVSLEDDKYKNKVVIVQIMGSWCPNCLDETKYLSTLYNKYNKEGLEVIALAFERTKSKEQAVKNLKNLKAKTGANYAFLLAGTTSNDKAAELLPMLNHIMSYPTAIYMGRNGEIRRIHTGFYGPSTGHFYNEFVKETEAFIKTLLAE